MLDIEIDSLSYALDDFPENYSLWKRYSRRYKFIIMGKKTKLSYLVDMVLYREIQKNLLIIY